MHRGLASESVGSSTHLRHVGLSCSMHSAPDSLGHSFCAHDAVKPLRPHQLRVVAGASMVAAAGVEPGVAGLRPLRLLKIGAYQAELFGAGGWRGSWVALGLLRHMPVSLPGLKALQEGAPRQRNAAVAVPLLPLACTRRRQGRVCCPATAAEQMLLPFSR